MRSAVKAAKERASSEDPGTSAVKTVRKALAILDVFTGVERPLSVAEVAVRANVTRPTAHRLVQTLVAEGYLQQDPGDGRLAPGYSVLKLAGRLLDSNRVRLESLPHLSGLASTCGERSSLGILHRNQLLYLAGVEKPSLPTIYSRFGQTSPACSSALGIAILAYLPDSDLQAYIDSEKLRTQPDGTVIDREEFLADLEKARREGLAVGKQGNVAGTCCTAAPILVDGKPVASIGLSGRSMDALMKHKETLQHTAEVISHVLSSGG